jgi:hypothetical protein
VKKYRSLKIVPTGVEAGIPLTHQPMEALRKEIPELLPESQHHHSLDVFIRPESITL